MGWLNDTPHSGRVTGPRRRLAGTYRKCGLMEAVWTGGAATDVRVRSPACGRWEKPDA